MSEVIKSKPSIRVCSKCGHRFSSSRYDDCYNCRPRKHNELQRAITLEQIKQDMIEFDNKVDKLRRLLAKIRRHQKHFLTTNEQPNQTEVSKQ